MVAMNLIGLLETNLYPPLGSRVPLRYNGDEYNDDEFNQTLQVPNYFGLL
jgi:hypothetical protein